MKHRVTLPESGIQIENTLSMALQKSRRRHSKLYLWLLALLGTCSSIMTFISMFSPVCNIPVVIGVMLAAFLLFSFYAQRTKQRQRNILGGFVFILIYVAVLGYFRKAVSCGLMYTVNTVYQAIYMTDWEYFTPTAGYSVRSSTTIFLCCMIIPIVCLLCYAVLRYQNFFLSLLITFPFVEIGFFFGVAPHHVPAICLFAFWCAMAAVQMADSGSYHAAAQYGFLRHKNTFFPSVNMQFQVTECAGMAVLSISLLVCFGIELCIMLTNYQRPNWIKEWRTGFQNYAASVDLSDMSTIFPFFNDAFILKKDSNSTILLGTEDSQEFENIPVTSIAFSSLPDGRVYLKYRTCSIYEDSSWNQLMDEEYGSEIFSIFDELDYHPQEFLFNTLYPLSGGTVSMTLYNTTSVLDQCVPYAFQKSSEIQCSFDDDILTMTNTYTIPESENFETIFSDCITDTTFSDEELLQLCENSEDYTVLQSVAEDAENNMTSLSVTVSGTGSMEAETALLCNGGYDEFVLAHYLEVPDTKEMREIYSAYKPIWENYDADTATPAETIAILQLIRHTMCNVVSYTLSPGKTPEGKDFIYYFLMENGKGYCAHYATAGTILARMAGIPARYCEGYMVNCDGNETDFRYDAELDAYTTEIMDSNAHAWTEIYISGIGWIPFEFTYSYFTEEQVNTAASNEETKASATTATNTENVPAATSLPTEYDEETTKSDNMLLPENDGKGTHATAALVISSVCLGIVFLLLLAVCRRHYIIIKRQRAFSQDDRSMAGRYAYKYFLLLLTIRGVNVRARTVSELAEDAVQKCGECLEKEKILMSVEIGARLTYSQHPLSEKEVRYLIKTTVQLSHGIYRMAKPLKQFMLKWFYCYL
jgi:transglutaminase-like putative cysteine protease